MPLVWAFLASTVSSGKSLLKCSKMGAFEKCSAHLFLLFVWKMNLPTSSIDPSEPIKPLFSGYQDLLLEGLLMRLFFPGESERTKPTGECLPLDEGVKWPEPDIFGTGLE